MIIQNEIGTIPVCKSNGMTKNSWPKIIDQNYNGTIPVEKSNGMPKNKWPNEMAPSLKENQMEWPK